MHLRDKNMTLVTCLIAEQHKPEIKYNIHW